MVGKKGGHVEVIYRPCNDEQSEKFITVNSEAKIKPIARSRKSRAYWSSKCTWDLKNGKPVYFEGRLINPPKLDISNLRTLRK